MNTYELVWHDYGNTIARNSVNTDPRPTQIEADDYELLSFGNGLGGVKFFREGNTEPFLLLLDLPLMITRVNP